MRDDTVRVQSAVAGWSASPAGAPPAGPASAWAWRAHGCPCLARGV